MDVVSAGGGKTSESDPDSFSRIQTPKPVSFSNGFLKRGNHGGGGGGGGSGGIGGGVVYKECLKNHAASIGAHAVDGCGEFMPSPTANSADPTSLKCAACGCHRNFHRQESDESSPSSNTTTAALEYQPHHRHHPPPPVPPPPPPPPHGDGGANSCPSSPSPPPISSSYYPSAPHLLLTLSGGSTPVLTNRSAPPVVVVNGRKRFRSRFTQDQKAKMLEFAEKLEWKMQRKDEEIITSFCNGIGVEKGVFKVWMHNNKNILGKKEHYNASPATINNHPYSNSATPETNNGNNISFVHHNHGVQTEINAGNNNHFHGDSFNGQVVGPNGSSSSS